jgi:HlyD family secretion protein
MHNRIVFALILLAALGIVWGAYAYATPGKAPKPLATTAESIVDIYANGIIESNQSSGENVNIYPEVTGPIVGILVTEGQAVTKGTPLVQIDDTVQRATTEQLRSQAQAAQAMLDELHAQPRKENLDVASAQAEMAQASLKTATDTLDKQESSYKLDPHSVSKEVLDDAVNGQKVAKANLAVATRQYDLTRAGAWVFDVRSQENQTEALTKAYAASSALLAKYAVKAPADGTVMTISAAAGGYVSPQGAYDAYTQGFDPIVVMGAQNVVLDVRCYVDEILIPRLPPPGKLEALLFIRGTNTKIPLEFVRLQPYVSAEIALAAQQLEKVDVRVLPAIFRFQPPTGVRVFPGEMVDVYIGAK